MMSRLISDPTFRLATKEDRPMLRGLLDTYLRDLRAFGASDSAYPFFDLYFEEEGRQAYVAQIGPAVAGFALVNRHAPSGQSIDHALAEFCVLPAFRRTGFGRAFAKWLFALHPGIWELSVLKRNGPASSFWRMVTTGFGPVTVIDAGKLRDPPLRKPPGGAESWASGGDKSVKLVYWPHRLRVSAR